jgi:hypothetical protein
VAVFEFECACDMKDVKRPPHDPHCGGRLTTATSSILTKCTTAVTDKTAASPDTRSLGGFVGFPGHRSEEVFSAESGPRTCVSAPVRADDTRVLRLRHVSARNRRSVPESLKCARGQAHRMFRWSEIKANLAAVYPRRVKLD